MTRSIEISSHIDDREVWVPLTPRPQLLAGGLWEGDEWREGDLLGLLGATVYSMDATVVLTNAYSNSHFWSSAFSRLIFSPFWTVDCLFFRRTEHPSLI